MDRRCLAADVLGDQVKLIGRHVETIGRLAALARGVFEYQVLASGITDGALHHLDVLAHAMLLVHDEVACLQRQRINGASPARGQAAHIASCRALTGDIRLSDEHETGEDESGIESTRRDVHDSRLRVDEIVDQPRGDIDAGKGLGNALRRAMTLGHESDHAAFGDPGAQIGDNGGVVALVPLAHTRINRDAQLGVFGKFIITGQSAEIPPSH